MLTDRDLMQIQNATEAMLGSVTIHAYSGGAPDSFAENLINIARQISGVSLDRIRLEKSDEPVLPGKPSLTLSGERGKNIHYLAAPEGQEFGPFLDALKWLGEAEDIPDSGMFEALLGLESPVQILVLVAAACPHCPQAVRAALSLAVRDPSLVVTVADALQFPDLADRFKVKSTPTIIIDEGLTVVGQVSTRQLAEHIVKSAEGGSLTTIIDSMIQSGRAEDAASLVCKEKRPEAVLPLYKAKEFSLRMGALVVLEAALDENPRILDTIVPDLAALLSHEEVGLRGDSAALLGKIGDPAAIPALRKATEDPDPDVKEAAEEALEMLEHR